VTPAGIVEAVVILKHNPIIARVHRRGEADESGE
jgi:hypothetical protein